MSAEAVTYDTTEAAVLAMTKGLGHAERVNLAKALRDALTALPMGSGAFEAGMRKRYADAAAFIEGETRPMDT